MGGLIAQFRDYFGCSIDRLAPDLEIKSKLDIPVQTSLGKLASPNCGGELESLLSTHASILSVLHAIHSLRFERYTQANTTKSSLQAGYYSLRPILPSAVRRFIHRRVFCSRQQSSFPVWPIDCSVEHLFRMAMRALLRMTGEKQIPFIWFWPDGFQSALMMTHDVEGDLGADRCQMLMDVNDSFGMPAAFQLVPEGPYAPITELVDQIRSRGYEVNLHDLDHDGRLYDNPELFSARAKQIRNYSRTFKTQGFRAGSMHRNQAWIPRLGVEYDMSVPNAAHLEPQAGGCCTVMPYFIDDVLELPLTTTQDYAIFHILRESSIDLWKREVSTITNEHGLMTFIVHPDYLHSEEQQIKYLQLLEYLTTIADDKRIWVTCPGEINAWWRRRRDMELVQTGSEWKITGEDCERATIAFATLVNDEVVYTFNSNQLEADALGAISEHYTH